MNTYSKFVPNVFLAKCPEPHEKGETIAVETRHGKENDSIVFNLIYQKDGFYYYSIVRADGFDHQAWAKNRALKLQNAAFNAQQKSNDYWKKSNKDSAFLSLGEPIKVGHHSEKRHRHIIEQAQNNMGKSVEMLHKAEDLNERAAYWDAKADTINLSMPESLDYYEFKLQQAMAHHEGIKNGSIPRLHAFSLTYAKKEVNELEDKVKLAHKLWA